MQDLSYCQKLGSTLVKHSINELFYNGNVETGSMLITKEVVESMCVDRASIWTFNADGNGIICDRIYIRETGSFHEGLELFEKDYPQYFTYLYNDESIVAEDAAIHPATSCFTDSYLIPLGIKSILDVPIWHRGRVIGVFCIENCSSRKWIPEEIYFAQMLSSLYSFSYSVRENNILISNLKETENFIDTATLVSKADAEGKITYVNEKFTEVSGWSLEEARGKDHNIVNSGTHPKSFWRDMYKTTTIQKKIWNKVVTNKNKNGELYYVDTFIKANFDENGDLIGFTSIRQDVTEIIETLNELDKKNTYLEHAAKILRHDMHSGINTYIPRGISSLERRISPEMLKQYKLDIPLRLLKEGLTHTQKVYKGVYEFTNLVKKDSELEREELDLKKILVDHLHSTAYSDSVIVEDLGKCEVNESLFCTAIDNLIRNGLKYNDSDTKWVKIYRNKNIINVEDNGRGISQDDFDSLSRPYVRKKGQAETGSGLGLNICVAILKEHGFSISCRKSKDGGTIISIQIK